MELKTLGTIAAVVGYVSAISAGAWALWRKVLRPMIDIVSSRYKALNAIPDIQNSLRLISEQLVPNGGASLRDAIDRLEVNQVLMGQKQGLMLSSSRISLMTIAPDGMVLDVTDPFCEMLDRSKDELLGNNWISAVHPDDREQLQSEWADAVEAHRSINAHFRFVLEKDRSEVKVYFRASALPPFKNKPQGYLGVVTRR